MKIQDFYYSTTPTCIVDSKEYKKARALYRLKKIDDLEIERIIVGKNRIKLVSKDNIIIIHDLDKYMMSKDLQRCLEYNYPIIKHELKKMHKTDKPLKNIKGNVKRVIAGSLTLSMLFATYKLKDLNTTFENNNELKVRPNIEEDNNTIIDKIENIVTNDIEESNPTLSVSFENLSDSEKALYVQKTYGDLINTYSNKWGVDPGLVTAILTQESGGMETNLMQIEYNAWKDQVITSKNFNDNSNVKIVLTESPELYDSTILTISKDDLNNPKTNISVGTILLTYNLKNFNYNIPIALTSYNCGIGTMNKIIETTSLNTGISKEDLINDSTNLEFLNYRYIMTDGDQNYFENVMRYIPNLDEIKVFDNNDDLHVLKVSFNEKVK